MVIQILFLLSEITTKYYFSNCDLNENKEIWGEEQQVEYSLSHEVIKMKRRNVDMANFHP
jgi:hypothetical protein